MELVQASDNAVASMKCSDTTGLVARLKITCVLPLIGCSARIPCESDCRLLSPDRHLLVAPIGGVAFFKAYPKWLSRCQNLMWRIDVFNDLSNITQYIVTGGDREVKMLWANV